MAKSTCRLLSARYSSNGLVGEVAVGPGMMIVEMWAEFSNSEKAGEVFGESVKGCEVVSIDTNSVRLRIS